jgi:protein-S-isoprenylcysteine O-methyltransferase Ste14
MLTLFEPATNGVRHCVQIGEGKAMKNQPDRPGVVILPPLLMVLALMLVLVLRHFWPLATGARVPAIALGIALCVLGIVSMAWGRVTLMKGGTNVNPLKPTTAIVTSGPFRFTRNPLYVGIMGLFVGVSLLIDTWWGIVVLIPVSLIIHFGVVLREETYLERKFGDSYLSYKAAVRRYL